VAWLAVAVLACVFSSPAQSEPVPAISPAAQSPSQQPSTHQFDPQAAGVVSGTVVDKTGAAIAAAQVVLTRGPQAPVQETISAQDGSFSFANVPSGPFMVTISATGFRPLTISGALHPAETFVNEHIALELAPNVTEVDVVVSRQEVAQEEMKVEEKQRVLGVIPNFYVSYIPDAAPLNSKQKFELAWKSVIDPMTFVFAGAAAGFEQSQDAFSGYGQGAQGYAKRFGASYGDTVVGTFIGSALLPSILKQDPRYFYKGVGSTHSRLFYALANAVICKGDNKKWQPNYSSIGGSLAAGGISNLYYPAEERGAANTIENALIAIGGSAAANVFQEFIVKKFTPSLNRHHPES
jgi:hypothetical protein